MGTWLANIMISIFGVNWKTNLNGWLVLACGSETAAATFNIVQILPPEWQTKLHAVCFLFVAFGLLSAKDNNVTNSVLPTEPKKVPATAPAVGS